jgi:hypothetical protein
MKIPAVTIVAACIKAKRTGVGPAANIGSQVYNGICADLQAPMNKAKAAAVNTYYLIKSCFQQWL